MTEDEVTALIASTARIVFRQPDLSYDSGLVFQDILGFDSVQAVQFILAMEKETGVTISEDEVDRMNTMGDAAAIIGAKLRAGPRP